VLPGQVGEEDTKGSLEKIKKQLNAGSGSVLLQGTLLKRSETVSCNIRSTGEPEG
jgi:hypothetical protein